MLTNSIRCIDLERNSKLLLKNTSIFSLLFFLTISSTLFAQNPIVTENLNAGTPGNVWDGLSNGGSPTIQGFATEMSVNKGETVRFKIDVNTGSNKDFTIKIYRLGYYGGNGAREMVDLGTFTGVTQPSPQIEPSVGLVDCGNWLETANWTVPSDAVSGIYIAKLERVVGGASHIVFIVRDDSRNSDLLFKTSDATWQAYNNYGGPSLYGGGVTSNPEGRASKVSYNRPFNTRSTRPANFVFNSEFAMLQWLERNGYDVTYSTDVDFERDPAPITPSKHRIIMSVGHDEYWSKNQRNKVEAARNAGVHLAFFSGNEIYWKTRWENSIAEPAEQHRTLVVYKEGLPSNMGEYTCGTMDCDPNPANEWTGLWRYGAEKDGGKPENSLSGQASWLERSIPLQIPDTYKNLRFWRNTSIANLSPGASASLGPKILGYEWNYDQEKLKDFYPKGRIIMSKTSFTGDGTCCAFQDNGSSVPNFDTESGRVYIHKLSLYRHSSGALVFGAGTLNWAWGLSSNHDVEASDELLDIQQATINLFADMGVQPESINTGSLAVASIDNSAPVVTITSPGSGTNVGQGKLITVTGTVTDANGTIAGVEISLDGGLTWEIVSLEGVLDNSMTWSYSFILSQLGNFTVIVRGFDDSGNMGLSDPESSPGSITLVGTCPCSVFTPLVPQTANYDEFIPAPSTFGLKFRSTTDGYIIGARFFKSGTNTGTRSAQLYTTGGSLLTSAEFVNETSSGWQQVNFPAPVQIFANTTYIIAYYDSDGGFAQSPIKLDNSITRGPLKILANGEDGANGLWTFGFSMPGSELNGANLLIDPIFNVTQTNCNITGSLEQFGQICAEQQISLKLNSANGAAPYSLNLNGNVINNVTPNVAFGTNIVANNTSLINVSIWPSSAIGGSASSETGQRELGVKFRSSVQGSITAIRFYKTVETGTGTFPVRLYDLSSGELVNGFSTGSITITNEGVSGWQQATLNAPVPVLPNRTYVATYVAQNGRYAESPSDLNLAKINGPLTALADNTDGPNGIYKTGNGSGVPTQFDNNGTNYWVDVVFTATNQIRLTEIIDNYGNICFANNPNIQTLDLQPVNCLLLPVTFQEFRLSVKNNDINLFWSTASESNNKGFQIQRSLDGNNWINIGFVNGAGNSQTLKKYQYPDRGLKDGRYFYRLKQFDLNGDFKYSKVISAAVTNKLSYVLGQNYPNPARQNTTISYSVPVKSPVEMSLYDMQGRQVKMLVNEIKESGTHTIDLDTRKLSKGVYHYKMKSGSYSDVKRLLVE